MPVNNLRAPIGEGQSQVSEGDFNRVIDLAEEIYEPIFARMGGDLYIRRYWEDPTVNATASRVDNFWVITMFGGLARRPETTVDGFTMVLCHEIGHHLAGFPYVEDWASNEGQSDYYGAQTCLRKIFSGSDNRPARIPYTPGILCNSKYSEISDSNLCIRTMLAAKSTADLVASLNQEIVYFTEQDTQKVSVTLDSHPNAQCRLDTMMAAALCDEDWNDLNIPVNEEEMGFVSCVRKDDRLNSPLADLKKGFRPKCWYAP